MESSILKKAGKFLREQGKNNRWRKILTVLGAIVVFVTAYILLMPAVALEHKSVCGLEEHTHTEECYGQAAVCGKVGAGDESEEPVTLEFVCTFPEELHVHTRECYDGEDNLICGYADYAVHEHTQGCYEDGRLVCPLEEIEEHEHTESCYRVNDSGYICGQEEAEAHTHADACYTENRELTCEEEEREGHTHIDDCYTEEWVTVCGLEDDPEHVHDEYSCYEVSRTLTCQEEEREGHQHGDSCYHVESELTCGKEENLNGHKHTESCRGVVKELVCGKDEVILHEHTAEDGCYEAVMDNDGNQMQDENGELLWRLVCDKPEVLEHVHDNGCYQEHVHTEECFAEDLICGKEEHVHTEECFAGTVYCGLETHTHTEECYEVNEAGEKVLKCGLEEHEHSFACYIGPEVSEEDRERILYVDQLIDELPSYEEIGMELAAYEEAGDDEGYEEYYLDTAFWAEISYRYYEDLDELQKYVVNGPKLLEMSSLWEASTMALDNTASEWKVTSVNQMTANSNDNKCALFHGDNKSIRDISTSTFLYWSGCVVGWQNERYEVIKLLKNGESKANEKIPEGGCILFFYGDEGKAYKEGDIVEFALTKPFNELPQGAVRGGYGTVFIGDTLIAPKEPKDNQVTTVSDRASTAGLININLYDYGSNINDLYKSDHRYPGFQDDGGTKTIDLNSGSLWGAKGSYNFGGNIVADLNTGFSLINQGGLINATVGGANTPLHGVDENHPSPMNPNLGEDGYPELKEGGISLGYLFSNSAYATRKNRDGLDGLFRYDETTGEYSFDSRSNFAEFDAASNQFIVYDALLSPNYMMYPFGNFLPFSKINTEATQASEINRDYFRIIAATAAKKAKETTDGNLKTAYETLSRNLETFVVQMDEKYGSKDWGGIEAVSAYFATSGIPRTFTKEELEKIYSVDYDEAKNFFFGMSMEMDFSQPVKGLTGLTNDIPMEFNFAGDDDVWIYIDEMLYLNLSGIHRHVGGKIDFVNGRIYYYDLTVEAGDITTSPDQTDTFEQVIRRSMKAAGKTESEIVAALDATLKKENGVYTTFKDNSAHNFKFYYMERGAGSGVCKINFNFPLLEKNALALGKSLSVDNGEVEEVLGNPDFLFQVLAANSNNDKPGENEPEELFIKKGTAYNVYRPRCGMDTSEEHRHNGDCYVQCKMAASDEHRHSGKCYGDNPARTGITGEGGIITLKKDECAVFPELSVISGGYYIRELFDSSSIDQYADVQGGGSSTTDRNDIHVGDKTFVGKETEIYHMLNGSTFFAFDNKVKTTKLGRLKITKELVIGEVDAESSEETFRIEVQLSGTKLPVGTSYTVTNTDGTEETRTVEKEGIILLKGGETALIEKILAGTEYTIQEDPASTEGYQVGYKPPAMGNEMAGDEAHYGKPYVKGIVSIYDEDETKISTTITNTTKGTGLEIPIHKLFSNPDGSSHAYRFQLVELDGIQGNAVEDGRKGEVSLVFEKGTADMALEQETRFAPILYLTKNLKDGETATYYYQITELAEETETEKDPTVRYDETAYTVEVQVTRKNETVTVKKVLIHKEGVEPTEVTLTPEENGIVTFAGDESPLTFKNTLLHDLTVRKLASGGNSSEATFKFDIELTGSNETVIVDGTYPYEIERVNDNLESEIQTGEVAFQSGKASIELRSKDTLTIKGLPYGVSWKVVETTIDGYYVGHITGEDPVLAVDDRKQDEKEGAEASGELTETTDSVTFINRTTYELPESGGPGTNLYTMAGISLLLMAGLMYRKKIRERRAGSSRN
ncbi:MAG: hypothetical protein HFI19_15975 [Lachnospiraceae bacterium]|nr:hypothetical protein [Lachnospiraceae bacterium]